MKTRSKGSFMRRWLCVWFVMSNGCGGAVQNLGQDPDAGRTAVEAKDADLDASRLNKVAFVTSHVYSANLGGLSGADATCQAHAETAGLPGVYKAWLSDSMTSAADRLSHATVPYSLVDGTLIANDWSALTSGHLVHSIDLSETRGPAPGVRINPDPATVWTGTDPSGLWENKFGEHMLGDCNGWTTTGDGSVLFGFWGSEDDGGSSLWTACWIGDCTYLAPLYCLEQ